MIFLQKHTTESQETGKTPIEASEKQALKKEEIKAHGHEKGEEKELGEIDSLKEKLKETEDSMKRIAADFDNYRKRAEREKTEWMAIATVKTIDKFLPVADSIDKAASTVDNKTKEGEGIHLIKKQFWHTLESLGVKEIEAFGKEFDSNAHECLASEKVEGKKNMEITEVIQKGFTYNSRLLRPAKVKINKTE